MLPQQDSPLAPGGDELNLGDIFENVLRGKWWILASFTVCVLIGGALVAQTDPLYEATSLVHIENKGGGIEALTMTGVSSGSSMGTEMRIIKSRSIAGQVLARMQAMQVNPLSGAPFNLLESGKNKSQVDLIEKLRGRALNVATLGADVDLLKINYQSVEPEDAAEVANLYADEYEVYDRRVNRQSSSALRAFFDDQVQRLDSTVRAQEGELIRYLDSQSVVEPASEAQMLISQIQGLQQEVFRVESRRRIAEASLEGLEREISRLRPTLVDQIRNTDLAVIGSLREQVAALEGRLELFYAQNPGLRGEPAPPQEVAEIIRSLEALRSRIESMSDQVAADIANGLPVPVGAGPGAQIESLIQRAVDARIELVASTESLTMLSRSMRETRGRINQLPQKSIYLERYERDLELYQSGLLQVSAAAAARPGGRAGRGGRRARRRLRYRPQIADQSQRPVYACRSGGVRG